MAGNIGPDDNPSRGRRRVVITIHAGPDDEGDMTIREAIDIAIPKHVLNPGETYEVEVHDAR